MFFVFYTSSKFYIFTYFTCLTTKYNESSIFIKYKIEKYFIIVFTNITNNNMGINYEESCRQLVDYIELRIIWIESTYWDNQTDKNKYYLDTARENWDDVEQDNINNLSDFKIYINYILRKMDKLY